MTPEGAEISTVEHNGFTVTSNFESPDQLKASFAPPAAEPSEASEAPAKEAKSDVKTTKVDDAGRVHEQDGKFRKPDGEPEKEAEPKAAKAEEPAKEDKPEDKVEVEKRRRDARWRVEQATAQAATLKRERESLSQENARLKAELESRTAPGEKPAPAPRETRTGPTPPDPEKYETLAQYLDARDSFNRQQWQSEERTRHEQEERTRQITTSVETFQKALKDQGEDFYESIDPAVLQLKPSFVAMAEGERLGPLNAIADEIIRAGANAPTFMRYFSENSDELQRLSTLPPRDLLREMGRIEAKLEAATAGKPAKPTSTYAPAPFKPLRPVEGAPHNADSADDEMSLDFDKFAAKRTREGRFAKR